jgi:acyl-coenzyme A synthetase/AMP-(fatty) acid ligase
MYIDFLLDIFKSNRNKTAFIWQGHEYNYEWFLDKIIEWQNVLNFEKVKSGAITAIESSTNPWSIALLLAMVENGNIIVPLTTTNQQKKKEYLTLSQVLNSFVIDEKGDYSISEYSNKPNQDIYDILINNHKPGLVLFTSGTSGKSKASVHDFTRLLQKYKTKGKDFRTLLFMMFDHIGGVDTLFYSLSNGSSIVNITERSPENICQAIEQYHVEVLPTTPTFLRLLLLSELYKKYNFNSLKYITYGTEPMPQSVLDRFNELYPNIIFLQKYGTTEVGTLRSKSLNSGSTWVKIGGDGYQIRVVDNILQIKAGSAMLGYLNAPSPFSEDGWFITGDKVEEKDGYINILGRESEIINVGGEKVYPVEVENVILELDFIEDVRVYGEKNDLMGNIVVAEISIESKFQDLNLIKRNIKQYCKSKLEHYKVPVKILFSDNLLHSDRFKKIRNNSN